jgi:predicted house-cleaning noncanonical NTP pyrophosphatase (MazG superfamily)/DNA-binding protein Fis
LRALHNTPVVFIDTCVFTAKKFNFNSILLNKVKEYFRKGLAVSVTTKHTIWEIETNFAKQLDGEINAINGIKTATIRSELGLQNIDFTSLKSRLLEEVAKFFSDCESEILDFCGESVSEVFESFRSGKAPFIENKKNREFPDAFVISSLARWSAAYEAKVFVVSSDKGFLEASSVHSNLKCHDSLESCLAEISAITESIQLKAVEIAEAYIQENVADVRDYVREAFENFSVHDVHTAHGSECYELVLEEVSDADSIQVIEYNQGRILFSIKLHFTFTAKTSVDHYVKCPSDKDYVLVDVGYSAEEGEGQASITVEIISDDGESWDAVNTDIDLPRELRTRVERDW